VSGEVIVLRGNPTPEELAAVHDDQSELGVVVAKTLAEATGDSGYVSVISVCIPSADSGSGAGCGIEAATGDPRICAALVTCDPATGKASTIKHFMLGE